MDETVRAEFMTRARKVTIVVLAILVGFCILSATVPSALAQTKAEGPRAAAGKVDSASIPWIVMAAALSVLGATLGAGYAVAHVGAAALGAASEKPEIMGRAIVFVGMAEGLVVFGFGIAVMLILKI